MDGLHVEDVGPPSEAIGLIIIVKGIEYFHFGGRMNISKGSDA